MNSDHAQQIEHLCVQLDTARQTASEQAERIARLEAEVIAAAARIADATADRDAWRSQAAALANRAEASPPMQGGFSLLRFFKRTTPRPTEARQKP